MEFEFDLSEIYDNLENLELNLLDFNRQIDEGKINTDGIHTSFRFAHNLKGTLALIQKNLCSTIIHAVESNFDLIRKGKQQISIKLIEKSLAAIDLIRDFVDNDFEDDNEAKKIIDQLNILANQPVEKKKQTNSFTEFELTEQQNVDLQIFVNDGQNIILVEKLIKSDISEEFYTSMPIFEDINQIGKIIAIYPAFKNINKITEEIVLRILFATKLSTEDLEYVIFDPFRQITIEKQVQFAQNTKTSIACNNKRHKYNFLVLVPNFIERAKITNVLCEQFCCFTVISLSELEEALHFSKQENHSFLYFYSSDKSVYNKPEFHSIFNDLNAFYQKKSYPQCTIIEDFENIPDINSAVAQKQKITLSKPDIEDFLSSANEIIENLEHNIIELEKTKSDKNILEIFRLIHNLKGDAAFVSLQSISDYAHHLENLYVQLKNKEISVNEDIAQLLLQANDFIKNAITTLSRDHINIITQEDVDLLQEKIYATTGKMKLEKKPEITDTKEKVFLIQIEEFTFMITEALKTIKENPASKSMMLRALQNLVKAAKYKDIQQIKIAGENCLLLVENNDFENLAANINNILLELNKYKDIIYQKNSLNSSDLKENNTAKTTDSNIEFSEIKTMRINEQKVDKFYNLVGELIIARNSYDFYLSSLKHNQNIQIKPFRDNLHLFSRLISELQSEVNSMRMIPLNRITQKFNRVIFDIAKSQNKLIEFRSYGVDTEIDKKVAEILSEPLVHIIRNSCDHGIEIPQKRKQNGKPETGIIELNAKREGSNLILNISDDGAGIDSQRLINKAVQMGFDISIYNEETILNLIYEAGFTTKQQVTGLSGRGVGMDIVKTTLERLNGTVNVSSVIDKGTTITLTVPISIGVNKALMVQSDNQIYAFPFESILKTLKLHSSKIIRLFDRWAFHYKDEIIILSKITNLLNHKADEIDLKEKIGDTEINIILLKTKQGKIGVLVDKLHSNMELAVKPLPIELEALNQFSGVSILGNGKVILMVNPDKIV